MHGYRLVKGWKNYCDLTNGNSFSKPIIFDYESEIKKLSDKNWNPSCNILEKLFWKIILNKFKGKFINCQRIKFVNKNIQLHVFIMK